MTPENTLELSSCCKSSFHVSTADEGTSCWMCSKYNNPCDPYSEPTQELWQDAYPLSTFTGETKRELVELIHKVGEQRESAMLQKCVAEVITIVQKEIARSDKYEIAPLQRIMLEVQALKELLPNPKTP